MKKNKIIYTVLFLTSAVSCSNFRPLVLTNAFINPESTANVDYEDLNFSYALFNQYASGLEYVVRINRSTQNVNINNTILFTDPAGTIAFTEWDIINPLFAEATLGNAWRTRFNTALFDRSFNRTTKKANTTTTLAFRKNANEDSLNLEIIIKSKISYNVNVASVYLGFLNSISVQVEQFSMFMFFFNSNNVLLQTVLLDTDRTITNIDRVYNLANVLTGVNSFHLMYQYVDTPGFTTANSVSLLYELNLFTENQEISIPDDASGDVFGFEFVAVEWWNILGHLQNFLWYIFNVSPIAPLFVFIEDYVLVWISGLITFITGIFRL